MVKLVAQESVNGRIRMKFEGLFSICPFTGRKDQTNFELSYIPGRSFSGTPVRIDPENLQSAVASFENKKVSMEVIPIEILKSCVEGCVSQRQGRYAAPDEVEITSLSFEPGEGKDWGIEASLRFERKVLRIGESK